MGQAVNRAPINLSPGATLTGSFVAAGTQTSSDIAGGTLTELAIDLNVTTITGTSPTLQLTVNRKGADGVYYQIYQGASINATGKQSVSIGSGFSGSNTAPVSFGNLFQVVLVAGGTVTSIVYTISIQGK
jgi:hypothetical protein